MAKLEGTIKVEVVNMIKGMTTCKVCGRDFALIKEDHYIGRDATASGLVKAISGNGPTFYDAFDCPHCGCQNIVQVRKIIWFSEEECPCDFGECEEARNATLKAHDGCVGCKYQDREEDEDPCVRCKFRYVDRWEDGENE